MIRLQSGELTRYVGDLVLSGANPDGSSNALGCSFVDKGHNDLFDECFTVEGLKADGLTVTSAVRLFKFEFNGDLWLLVATDVEQAWTLIENEAKAHKWDPVAYRKRWHLMDEFDATKPGIHRFYEDRSGDD
jgi:hypothetical protein